MNQLKGKHFHLRKWTMEDVDSLVHHANNIRIAENLRDGFPHPYTPRDAEKWIQMVINNSEDVIFAIDVEGEACGGIGLHGGKDVYRFNAEIGYWLSQKHWGKGIMTEAVGLLVDYGFTHHKWIRIHAGVFHTNEASMKVLQKCGFKEEARFSRSVKKGDQFLDEHIYSILKDQWTRHPTH